MMRIDRIYSSDLDRAARTAAAIGRRVGLDVQYLPALREIHFGLWEGLNWREIEDQFPDEARRWLLEFPLRSAPGGEPYPAFTARVDAVIAPLLRESANDTTAVVTHCGVMRYVLKRFFDFSDEQAWTLTAPYGAVVVGDSRIRQAGACRVV
jgi:broad specificity phosphatase PhoE